MYALWFVRRLITSCTRGHIADHILVSTQRARDRSVSSPSLLGKRRGKRGTATHQRGCMSQCRSARPRPWTRYKVHDDRTKTHPSFLLVLFCSPTTPPLVFVLVPDSVESQYHVYMLISNCKEGAWESAVRARRGIVLGWNLWPAQHLFPNARI